MLAPNLPMRAEDIDAEWVTSALRTSGHNLTVTNVRIVEVIKGTSTKVRIALEYDEAGGALNLPNAMCVKGGLEDHSERFKTMYADEAFFYGTVGPEIPLNMPKCYFAGSDPDSWQSLILMEDLVDSKATFCRAQEPFSFDHIHRRMQMLAGMHARTWECDEIKPGGAWDRFESRFHGPFSSSYMEHYLQPDIWRYYVESPRGAAVSVDLHDADRMRRALARLGEIELEEPLCLIHGDTHPGNLYVEADGTPGFLDCIGGKACWWLEIAYHIVCACDIATRPKWEGALLSSYLDALSSHGIDAPDFDTAWLRYRQSLAHAFFIFQINETHFQTESTNTAYNARIGIAMIEHDTMRLLDC